MEDRYKCNVVVNYPKPKLYKGYFYPDENCGTYGFRKKQSFAVTSTIKPLIPDTDKKRWLPMFAIDPNLGLAQPIGQYLGETTEELNKEVKQLNANLEIVTQKKYVKAATVRVFDMVQTIIIMFAGAGALYFILKLISIFTGNAVTI